ncbi:MAG: HEAT repeat domain-containing protein [Candidatus Riflebacteria bacterium]|nr:HEAT repeat domain-containing protein [Candidatus Riflebacteria bacterium]
MQRPTKESSLIADLNAPISSFRVFALEEIIRSGKSVELLEALKKVSQTETVPECQLLIKHALQAVSSRLEGNSAKPAALKNFEAESFLNTWRSAGDEEKMSILSSLPTVLPKNLKALGPELIKGSEPVIAARIIRTFSRGWPKEDFAIVAEAVSSESLVLKLAALRTVLHLAPESIEKKLPPLLTSSDPQVKALAIRVLAKIDEKEAVAHLSGMLFSADQNIRLAGITHCPFLPFEAVKSLLLKYLSAETHMDLIERAGWIIETNPDIQIPFKLYEIMERSPAKKANAVKSILQNSVELVKRSGILGDKFDAYKAKLNQWLTHRASLRFVNNIFRRIESEYPDISAQTDAAIKSNLKNPTIMKAFEQAMDWPVSDKVKAITRSYLDRFALSASSSQKTFPEHQESPYAFASDSSVPLSFQKSSEQIKSLCRFLEMGDKEALAALSYEDFKDNEALCRERLHQGAFTVSAQTLLFASLTNLKYEGFTQEALQGAYNGDNDLANAALRYLATVDPEAIMPMSDSMIASGDPEKVSLAFVVLKNTDYNKAFNKLAVMINNRERQKQLTALDVMEHFDFSLIKDMLASCLSRTNDIEILELGLRHFAANPSVDNLYTLYKIERGKHGHAKDAVKSVRNASLTDAMQFQEFNPDDFSDDALEKAWQNEIQQRQAQKPAYAFVPPEEQEVSSKAQLAAIYEWMKETVSTRPKTVMAIMAILTALAYGYVSMVTPKQNFETKGGAVLSQQSEITATAKEKIGNYIIMEAEDGTRIAVNPSADLYLEPQIGSKVILSYTPFRRDSDGIIHARIQRMEINQQ